MYIDGSSKINYIDMKNLSISEEGKRFFLSQTNYTQGESKHGIKSPVFECNLKNTEAWEELLSFSIHKPYNFMLSKSSPEGIPRHFDIRKWTVINLPLIGDFVKGHMIFVDDKDNEIDQTTYSNGTLPVLFNARNLHAVLPFDGDRVVLSICWIDPFEIILQKYYTNQLFNDFLGKFFKYKNLIL